jgi:hypothetical protein
MIESMTNYTFKTNKSYRTTTSSRYQMSFYSITTHGQLRLFRLLSISLITSAPCRLAYAIMSKEETLLPLTLARRQMFERQPSLGTQAIYIKRSSTTGRVVMMGASEGHAHSAFSCSNDHCRTSIRLAKRVQFSIHFLCLLVFVFRLH